MKLGKLAAAVGAAAISLSLSFGPAVAQDKRVRINMPGAFPGTMALLGPAQIAFAEKVKKLSNGSIDMRFFEPGALVPASQYFDAVANGSLEFGLDRARLLHRQGHRLRHVRVGAVRAGGGRVLGWMNHGGGEQLYEELHAKFNVEAMPCGSIAPEASGWFRKEIKIARRPQGPEDALLRSRRQRDAEARRRRRSCCRRVKSSRRCSSAPSTPPSSRCRSWT